MAGSASIQVSGISELTHALDGWAGEVKAPRIMFVNLVSDVIAPAIQKRFAQQGPGWVALSPAYATWKQLHYPGKPILVRSGKLEAAMTDRSRFGGQQSRFGPNVLDLSPDIVYFATHQFGRGRIPARPIIVLSEIEGPIHAYITNWLSKRAKDFGLQVGA